jgi:hypothetical protein
MRKLLLAAAAVTAFGTPALADFWIVRETPTGPCKIVTVKPTDTKVVIVGDKTYTVRSEAEAQMKVVCK